MPRDEEGPDGDIAGDTPESPQPSSSGSSETEGSSMSTATEETVPGVSPSMAPESMRCAHRWFEENSTAYDVKFIYHLNTMMAAVVAVQAGVAVRAARHVQDIRSFFRQT